MVGNGDQPYTIPYYGILYYFCMSNLQDIRRSALPFQQSVPAEIPAKDLLVQKRKVGGVRIPANYGRANLAYSTLCVVSIIVHPDIWGFFQAFQYAIIGWRRIASPQKACCCFAFCCFPLCLSRRARGNALGAGKKAFTGVET